MNDPHTTKALEWANSLGPPPPLPKSLEDPQVRARLIEKINWHFQESLLPFLPTEVALDRARRTAQLAREFLPDVEDTWTVANVVLRLWSGCIAAAKGIAEETRGGPQTPEERSRHFTEVLDPISAEDPIHKAGVEAAPLFKSLRGEPVVFDGVPDKSPVRRFAHRTSEATER